MAEDGCRGSLCIAGEGINKPGQQECGLPFCSPTGILCPSRVVFCRNNNSGKNSEPLPRHVLGCIQGHTQIKLSSPR